MRRLTLGLAVVLLTVGLAGCISGGDEGSQTQSVPGTNNSTPTLENPRLNLSQDNVYAYEGEITSDVRWENGTFSPSCFSCPSNEERYDVTGMLPRQAPSLLRVDVNTSSQTFGSAGVYLEADGAQIYQQNSTFSSLEATVAPLGGSIEVVVYGSGFGASTDYTTRIDVLSNRTVLPTNVPVAFGEPRSPAGIAVEPIDLSGEPRLMVWDGEDTFLGHYPINVDEGGQATVTVNLTEGEGDTYVAYLAGANGIARLAPINASATDTTMRPLGFEWLEETESVTSGEVSFPVPMERVPLQAGVFLRGSNEGGAQWSAQLHGPNGTLVDYSSGGYLALQGTQYSYTTARGSPELVAGDYNATFEFSQATGGEAGAMWLAYQR